MNWIFPTSNSIYQIFLTIAVIAIVAILSKESSLARKIISAIMTVVILAIIAYFINKPTRIFINPTGIYYFDNRIEDNYGFS